MHGDADGITYIVGFLISGHTSHSVDMRMTRIIYTSLDDLVEAETVRGVDSVIHVVYLQSITTATISTGIVDVHVHHLLLHTSGFMHKLCHYAELQTNIF